jgi:hypothetical protein
MEIEKIKLTQGLRKEAVKEAIQSKFKKRVEIYLKKLKCSLSHYALTRKSNKESIHTYSTLSDDFKRLVVVSSVVSFKDDQGRLPMAITCGMKYLDYGCNNPHLPFCTDSEYRGIVGSVTLPFSYPLIETDFTFDDNKTPLSIQCHLDHRLELITEINSFAKNMYHALCHVKNMKEVRQFVPALEQFIPLPEKQFTKIVPHSFFDKVNKSVNFQ